MTNMLEECDKVSGDSGWVTSKQTWKSVSPSMIRKNSKEEHNQYVNVNFNTHVHVNVDVHAHVNVNVHENVNANVDMPM